MLTILEKKNKNGRWFKGLSDDDIIIITGDKNILKEISLTILWNVQIHFL